MEGIQGLDWRSGARFPKGDPRAQLSKDFSAPKDKLPGEAGGGLV